MGILDELTWRGLAHQTTSTDLGEILERERLSPYVGFDPTATSLHAGSLIPLTALEHFRRHGVRPIVLIGGATGMVGDPSGKSEERRLESAETVAERGRALHRQVTRLFARSPGPSPLLVDNLDWLGSAELIEFLCDAGRHFSVGQMLQKDSVRKRFEGPGSGISYTEFTYQLLQAWDFLELFRRHGCRLQCGASDQWGNIVAGIELVRRVTGESAYGLTFPLLTNSKGEKYGKSEKGAVWLDAERTPPEEFHAFWAATEPADVGRFLRWFTFLDRSEIEDLERDAERGGHRGRDVLAREVTARVHGEEQARAAAAASR